MSAPSLERFAAASTPTLRTAYSDRTSALMAACAQLAYEPDPARLLATGGLQLRAVTARAYLAVGRDLAVLAWRGTASLADWRTDLAARLEPLPGAAGVRVHRGFLAAFQEDRPAVEAAIAAHVPAGRGLFITGHSLGGALAQCAAAAFDSDALSACYTFGSPRVATLDFDRLIKTPHYRVTNGWDPVPGVPEPWFRGYRHTGFPLLITGDDRGAYHRDRSPAARLLVDLAGLFRRGDLLCAADHDIGLYRARLELIAAARAAPARA